MFYDKRLNMTRSILHIVMKNLYASFKCLHNPEFRNYPVTVAGAPLNRYGIILAKNMMYVVSAAARRPGRGPMVLAESVVARLRDCG